MTMVTACTRQHHGAFVTCLYFLRPQPTQRTRDQYVHFIVGKTKVKKPVGFREKAH